MDQITYLPLAHLHDSPSNPRKRYPEAYLQELATDIKSHADAQHPQGRVLQPLLVRPIVPELFRGLDDPNATAG